MPSTENGSVLKLWFRRTVMSEVPASAIIQIIATSISTEPSSV